MLVNNLQGVTEEEAKARLMRAFPEAVGLFTDLDYWAWPKVYGSTAGPFGGIGGQAMTTFTIEAWETCGYAVVFCKGKVLRTISNFEGVDTRV